MRTVTKPDLTGTVEVFIGDRRYFVNLERELVWIEVRARGGRVVHRLVTSRRIETEAILKAQRQGQRCHGVRFFNI